MAEPTRARSLLEDGALAETIARATAQLAKNEAEFGDTTTPNEASLRRERLRVAGIPLEAHARRRIIENKLEHTPALDAVRPPIAAAANGHGIEAFIALLGERGRGKTTAAGWALAELGGSYLKIDRAGQLRKRERVSDGHEWDLALRSRVLVVDELGAERNAVDGELALLDLVDERQDFGRITILISNLSELDLFGDPDGRRNGRYDPRIPDRLRSVWRTVQLAGESYRKRRPWHVVLKVHERERDPRVIEERARSKREWLIAKAAAHENLIELDWARDRALELARIEAA